MTEVSSTNRAPSIKNPAPHRGFSSKAREVLIEPSSKFFANSIRHSSDHELLAKSQPKLERTDSQMTNTSTKSQSSTHSYPAMTEEFDSLDDLPKKCGKAKKTLGDIGKTKSAGDLLKNANNKKPATLIKTFQQLNIMRLPSVDSVRGDKPHPLSQSLNQIVHDPFIDDVTVLNRHKIYEMT